MKSKSLSFLLLFSALVIPGASFQDPKSEAAAKLLAQSGNGVLTLVVYDKEQKEIGRGSALVLSENTAVTPYHLISGAAKITALNLKKKEVDIDGILGVDKTLDLALLQIDGKVQVLPPSGTALAADLAFFALGSDELGSQTLAEGTIRKLHEIAPNLKVGDTAIVVVDTFDGAAVLDGSGKVIGLLNAYEKRLRFIVPQDALGKIVKGKLVPLKSWIPEDYFASVEAGWLSGRLLFWIGEPYAAQRGLDRVTKAQPSNLEAWKYLAQVYDRQRDYANAATAFQKIVELDPQNAAAYSGLGQIQARTQKFDDAVKNLEKALQLDPALVVANLYLGNSYDGLHEWKKAGDAYDKYLAAKPADAEQTYVWLANSRREAEQFEASAAALAEYLKFKPADNYQNYQMAIMLEKAKKYDEAEAAFIKTGELAKDPGKYFVNIIQMFDQANLNDKTIAAIKKWIAINPKNDQAHANLGSLYQRLLKYPEAIAAFKEAVAVKPTNDNAWFQIGYIYYNGLKNYREAIPAFEKNVEIVPNHVYGWMFIGMSRMQLKQFSAALDSMKKAVDVQPDNTDALMNLGVIYLNLKDKYSAQEIVKKLQALDPAKAAKLKSYIK